MKNVVHKQHAKLKAFQVFYVKGSKWFTYLHKIKSIIQFS